MDGWSSPIFFEELTRIYDAGGDASGLEPARPFRDYLAWLAGQDPDAGLGRLAGGPGRPRGADAGGARIAARSGSPAARGRAPGRRQRRPHRRRPPPAPHGELGGAGGLGRGSSAWPPAVEDVVFGATVAGRPPALDGIESMVGLFINTVPVRVPLRLGEPLLDLAERVQADQARLLDHHHLGLSRIIRAAAGADELFDTLVAFENFPDLADAEP